MRRPVAAHSKEHRSFLSRVRPGRLPKRPERSQRRADPGLKLRHRPHHRAGRRRARRRVSCSRCARHQRRRASAPRRLPVHDPRRMAALVRRPLLLGDRAHPRLRARHVRARLRAGRECLDQFHQVPAERRAFARCRLALVGAIASLFREVAPHNVTINSVLPGLVSTAAMQVSLHGMAAEHDVTYETVEKEIRAWAAADRFAAPEEVGDLIWMLCAAQMGYLTGQNIIDDGGAYQGLFCGVATADSPNEARRPLGGCGPRSPARSVFRTGTGDVTPRPFSLERSASRGGRYRSRPSTGAVPHVEAVQRCEGTARGFSKVPVATAWAVRSAASGCVSSLLCPRLADRHAQSRSAVPAPPVQPRFAESAHPDYRGAPRSANRGAGSNSAGRRTLP